MWLSQLTGPTNRTRVQVSRASSAISRATAPAPGCGESGVSSNCSQSKPIATEVLGDQVPCKFIGLEKVNRN